MIIGIGTDIIEIERVAKAISKESFLEKYFTEKEIDFLKKKDISSYAGNFAAKEAVAKSFGVGFRGFMPIDIEILRDEFGKPYVNLYKNAKEKSNALNINKIHVSISHCEKFATAYVIVESL